MTKGTCPTCLSDEAKLYGDNLVCMPCHREERKKIKKQKAATVLADSGVTGGAIEGAGISAADLARHDLGRHDRERKNNYPRRDNLMEEFTLINQHLAEDKKERRERVACKFLHHFRPWESDPADYPNIFQSALIAADLFIRESDRMER